MPFSRLALLNCKEILRKKSSTLAGGAFLSFPKEPCVDRVGVRHPDHRQNRTKYALHVPEKLLWTPQDAATMKSNLVAGRNAVLSLSGIFHQP
jgi:hypothetical protein